MEIIGWLLASTLFLVAILGLVYPVIPSALFMIVGFLSYGFIVSFEQMNWFFWVVQGLFIILLFGADMLSNLVGIKKFGGSKAGIWGSTIGLVLGPFIIPVAGILLGPFLGAVIAELLVTRVPLKQALITGIGSLIGFLTSVVTKGSLMVIMIVIFIIFITW